MMPFGAEQVSTCGHVRSARAQGACFRKELRFLSSLGGGHRNLLRMFEKELVLLL